MSDTKTKPITSRRRLLTGGAALSLGASVATLAGSIATPAPAAAAQPSLDAELIAFSAEYVALDRAFVANSLAGANMDFSDPHYEALHEEGVAMVPRLHELEDLIADLTPRTGEGLLPKAEAARRSLVSNGDDAEEAELMNFENYLACSVIENLLDMIEGQV